MFSRIQDSIGRTLLVLFLIKPLVDLTWFFSFSIGGAIASPLHVFAGLLFLYLLRFRFQLGRHSPPFAVLIEVFIALHFVAILIGMAVNPKITLVAFIDIMLRLFDWYLVYITAFLAASRFRYRDVTPFIRAIVIGSAIAVVLNAIAIPLHISPGVWEANAGSAYAATFRLAGLYHDPGVLANVAFFNLVFAIFLLHITPTRGPLMLIWVILLVMADLYLLAASKSRAVMVELAMFGMVYLWVFQKAWGKIFAPIAAALVLGAAVLLFQINLEDLFIRFDSDVAALEGEGDVAIGAGGQVSFGSLEGLGNNRVAIWADALTAILRRPTAEILFGTFSGSVSHSDYIDIVARTGVISLLVYLTFVIGMTVRTWLLARKAQRPHDRTLYFMGFSLLVCYLVYSLPFRPSGYTTTTWYMWAVLGLGMARWRLAVAEAAEALVKRRQVTDPTSAADSPADGRHRWHPTLRADPFR